MASHHLLVMASVNCREMERDGLYLIGLVIRLLKLPLLRRRIVEAEVPDRVYQPPVLGSCAFARDLVPHLVIASTCISYAHF